MFLPLGGFGRKGVWEILKFNGAETGKILVSAPFFHAMGAF